MTPQLALQLYTLRDAFAQDFSGTLRRIVDIGFTNIETAFFPDGITAPYAAQLFRDYGLTVCAAHCEIPLGDQQQPMLDMMAEFDCTHLIWHGWPQDDHYRSLDGIQRLATRYNAANAVAKAHGLSFGIHNHWWEFELVAGHRPYQLLQAQMDTDIFFEVDTYWVKSAGVDPVSVVTELGARAPILHIKDGPAVQNEPMVAAGEGTLDIPAIVQAAKGHAEWLIIELDDCATDMFGAVEKSFQYLTQNGFARA